MTLADRLYLRLQRTNLVKPSDLCQGTDALWQARDQLVAAGMELYHEERQIWVPGPKTYQWLVDQWRALNPTAKRSDVRRLTCDTVRVG